jgi:hypothetical protein
LTVAAGREHRAHRRALRQAVVAERHAELTIARDAGIPCRDPIGRDDVVERAAEAWRRLRDIAAAVAIRNRGAAARAARRRRSNRYKLQSP